MDSKENIIGINIKKRRGEQDLTQRQLAAKMDLDYTYIGRWERGVKPTAKYLNMLSKALGVSVEWLLGMNNEDKTRKIVREELAIKDLQFESTELNLKIPPPPDEFTGEALQRYDRNAGLLLRWAHTDKAQKTFPNGVEEYALERFCIEAAGFYSGGWIDDVSGLLKDYLSEAKEKLPSRGP